MSENQKIKKKLLIGFFMLTLVSLVLSLTINTMHINEILAWIFFIIGTIAFTITLIIDIDKNQYIVVFLCFGIILSMFFAFRVMILTPPREYLKSEVVCGVYRSTMLKPSRGRGRIDHIINIKNRSFVFSDKKPAIDFDGFTRGQKLCFELKRWKDKPEELNLAQLIAVKRI